MAIDEKLVFSGLRWAAARIHDRHEVPAIESVLHGATRDFYVASRKLPKAPARRSRQRPGDQSAGPTPCTIFTLQAPGGGRPWETTEPKAFWRNFAEIDFVGGDGSDVLRFTQRHGDPFNTVIAGNRTFDTLNWIPAATELKAVAQAWEPAGKDGVSRLSRDPKRLQLATNFLQRALSEAKEATVTDIDATGLQLVHRATTLHAFMVASATSAFRQKDSVRRCDHCADWFKPGRSDARFCSPSCRATNATTKEK